MNLLLCLTCLAFAGYSSAVTVTLSIWTSSSIAKAYAQTLVVPAGTTIEGLMNAAAANGNSVYAWSYISTNSSTAYLKVDGISDVAASKLYWVMFNMPDQPLLCGSVYPTGAQVMPYTYSTTTVQDGANYLLWYLKFPK